MDTARMASNAARSETTLHRLEGVVALLSSRPSAEGFSSGWAGAKASSKGSTRKDGKEKKQRRYSAASSSSSRFSNSPSRPNRRSRNSNKDSSTVTARDLGLGGMDDDDDHNDDDDDDGEFGGDLDASLDASYTHDASMDASYVDDDDLGGGLSDDDDASDEASSGVYSPTSLAMSPRGRHGNHAPDSPDGAGASGSWGGRLWRSVGSLLGGSGGDAGGGDGTEERAAEEARRKKKEYIARQPIQVCGISGCEHQTRDKYELKRHQAAVHGTDAKVAEQSDQPQEPPRAASSCRARDGP